MPISNTSILIKRSTANSTPTSLKAGELAYSYASNGLFIGTSDGAGYLQIGGFSSAANVANSIVQRNQQGAFFGRLFGVANSAVRLDTAQNFSITGDVLASSVSFDGTGAVALSAALSNTIGAGPAANNYGSSTNIPVLTVAANGRIVAVSNAAISTSFNISDGTTSSSFSTGNTFVNLGTKGITTAVTTNTITFGTDTTVLRSNTNAVGAQVINTNLVITGNLVVQGNTTTSYTNDLVIGDPMIYLGANNYTSDTADLGWAANYFDGTWERHTGMFRDSTNKQFYIFDNYLPELSGNNNIDTGNTSFRLANVSANLVNGWVLSSNIFNPTIVGGTISSLSSAIGVASGGTGVATFNAGQIIIGGGGTQPVQQLGNNFTALAAANTYANAAYNAIIGVDVYGRLASISNTLIQIDASQVTSGNLALNRGGTNQNNYVPGALVISDGTKFTGLANSTYTLTGALSAAKTITSLSVDAYGRVTAATGADIAIDASQINAGTLTVPRGGTGAGTFQSNGIIYGAGTGALQATALAGASDQTWSNQILTVTNTGTPVWATNMDGGSF
jgi:hypothetical protein